MIQQHLINQLISFKRSRVIGLLRMLCGCQHRRVFCSSRRQFLSAKHTGAFMEHAQTLWDYLKIDDRLEKSNLIMVLGNSDLRTADYAAQLYNEKFAPLVAVSGKEGHGTRGKWDEPEAVVFSKRLCQAGIPKEHIIMETQATNTGENIQLTQRRLQQINHPDLAHLSSIILVSTPFMGRRAQATFQKQWVRADSIVLMVTSPPIPLLEYADEDAGYRTVMEVVAEMVRNMHRIREYSTLGYQTEQDIPPHVKDATIFLQSFLKKNRFFRDL